MNLKFPSRRIIAIVEMEDCLELDDAKRIKSMQINYLHESKIGAKLDIYMKREDNIIYVYGYLENEVTSFQAEVEIE